MRSLSIEQQDILSVPEEECREFKPAILQPCNQVDCPPAWETEPWQLVCTTLWIHAFVKVLSNNLEKSIYRISRL